MCDVFKCFFKIVYQKHDAYLLDNHISGIHKLQFSWKFFHVLLKISEIMKVLSFVHKFPEVLQIEEKHSNFENIEDFQKSDMVEI